MNTQEISRVNSWCLIILTAIAVTAALIYTKPVIVPLVLAIFVYEVFWPLIQFLRERLKTSKFVASGIAVFGLIVVSFIVGTLVVVSVRKFAEGADVYEQRLIMLSEQIKTLALFWGFDIEHINTKDLLNKFPVFTWVRDVSGVLFRIIADTTLVIIFVLFMIIGASGTEKKKGLVRDVKSLVSKFLLAKVMVNFGTAVAMAVLFALCGVELAILFSVATFLLLFIPGLGQIVALVMPLPVVFLQYGFSLNFWIVLTFSMLVHLVLNNIVETKVMGDTVKLHPIVILASLIFWGLVWGVSGMFLAVPLTAAIKIVMTRIPQTREFAEVLEGRI